MGETVALVPVIMPSLALVLANAEKEKGSPLTEGEVKAIRDKCPCVMLPAEVALKMPESRGYVDVNPLNCWVDWHRLRAQAVGGYMPRIVLAIPGDGGFGERCSGLLQAEGVEHEFRPHDERLVRAFRSGSMTWPAFREEDFGRIGEHATVLYVVGGGMRSADGPVQARRFLKLGARLIGLGGIAIKCESSGAAHSAESWLMLADQSERARGEGWLALFRAYVLLLIGSGDELYSCGMHLLGAPDLAAHEEALGRVAKAGESGAGTAIRWFTEFGVYLLSECPTGKFAPGHTFSTDRDSPRLRAIWEPCQKYREDDLFCNPFGIWRFGGG